MFQFPANGLGETMRHRKQAGLPEDSHGKFMTKMSSFDTNVKHYKNLSKLHENLQNLYHNIMEHHATDVKKVSVEDFFLLI